MEKVFKWTTHAEAAADEAAYWRDRSIEERVLAVETLRKATPGIYSDGAAPRLERIHRLTVRLPR